MASVGVSSKGASVSGESNLFRLKKRLAWACAKDLAPMSADVRTQMNDADREKKMISELDRVCWRIKDARSEYGKAEEVFATNLPPVQTQTFTCKRCGNRNPLLIFADPRSGDTICRGIKGDDNCGEVVADHRVDTGAAKRNFADSEEDRNHHGPVGNIYMPDSVNMRTSFNRDDRGSGCKNGEKLSKISQLVEMGISNLGHDQRAATRTGFKTNQKNEAFRQMQDWGIALQIHDTVIEKAKAEFAKYREVRERVEKFTATVAGCIVISYEELEGIGMILEKKVFNEIRERKGLSLKAGPTNTGQTSSSMAVAASTDVAISCLQDKRMAVWTIDDAKLWLQSIANITVDQLSSKSMIPDSNSTMPILPNKILLKQAGELFINQMMSDYNEEKELASTKQKQISTTTALKPSFFNTTTIKGRAKGGLNGVIDKNNVATKADTIGKVRSGGGVLIALRVKLHSILAKNDISSKLDGNMNNIIANIYRDSIDRRVKYEEYIQKETRLADM